TGEDHLTGFHGAVESAAAHIVDAGHPGAGEAQVRHVGESVNGEVLAAPHRVDVGAGCREAPTPVHVAVERCEARLAVPIDVVGEGVARLLHGFEERAEQGGVGGAAYQHERSGSTTPQVGTGEAVLHALEVGQHV